MHGIPIVCTKMCIHFTKNKSFELCYQTNLGTKDEQKVDSDSHLAAEEVDDEDEVRMNPKPKKVTATLNV